MFVVMCKLKISFLIPSKVPRKDHGNSLMEQHAFKNVNNYLNTNIYSYLETSGGQSSKLYLNVVHFFNTSVNKTSVSSLRLLFLCIGV